jgi:glutaredoxin
MTAALIPRLYRSFVILSVFAVFSCSPPRNDAPLDSDGQSGPTPPLVTDTRTDLVLSWFVDGGAQIGSSVSEVPPQARKEVRVQDPTIPPENRDTAWVFLANLEQVGADGRYPVKAQRREQYESVHLRPQRQAPAPSDSSSPSALSPGEQKIVMYATKQCPVCKKARRWLLEQGIPYLEKDIERDEAAAMELQKKGRAQGVPTNGVPVFDIGGKLVPGFDPKQLLRLLAPSRNPGDTKVI